MHFLGRWLLEKKHCQPDRLGIVGINYGGYSVTYCLEQAPALWVVGVSIVGYFNWFTATKNERGRLQIYDRNRMETAEENAELFRKYSPIFYLDQIRARSSSPAARMTLDVPSGKPGRWWRRCGRRGKLWRVTGLARPRTRLGHSTALSDG